MQPTDFYASLSPGVFHIIIQDVTISSLSTFRLLAGDPLFNMMVMVMSENVALTVPDQYMTRVSHTDYNETDPSYKEFMSSQSPRLLIVDNIDTLYNNESKLTSLLRPTVSNAPYDRSKLVVIVFAHYGFNPLQFAYISSYIGGYKVYSIPVNVSGSQRPIIELHHNRYVGTLKQKERYLFRMIQESSKKGPMRSYDRLLADTKVRSRRELNTDYPDYIWEALKMSAEERKSKGVITKPDAMEIECIPNKGCGWINLANGFCPKSKLLLERVILEPAKKQLIVCRFKEHYGSDYLGSLLSLMNIDHTVITGDTPSSERQTIINQSKAKVILMDWIDMKKIVVSDVEIVHLYDIPDGKRLFEIFGMVNSNLFNSSPKVLYNGYIGYLPFPEGQKATEKDIPGERTVESEFYKNMINIIDQANRTYKDVYSTSIHINFVPVVNTASGTAGYKLTI